MTTMPELLTPSVNFTHLPPSKSTPPGASKDTSPEQFAFVATTVQGTPTSASSEEPATEQYILDLRSEIGQLLLPDQSEQEGPRIHTSPFTRMALTSPAGGVFAFMHHS